MDLNKELEKYARLICEVGLNLKEGDKLQIRFNVWGLELARKVADRAYEMGVLDVILAFRDEAMDLSFYNKARDVEYYPDFHAKYQEELAANKYHYLAIGGSNPELLRDVDPERVKKALAARGKKNMKVMEYHMTNFIKWTIVAVPTPEWARQVFPEMSPEEAMANLWKNIFMAARVDREDPVAAWKEHDQKLKEHEDFLNAARFEKLRYQGPGTDLEVYLVKNHLWVGGSGKSLDGEVFMANIPTEEIFTMPDKDRVNGVLKATMPLALRGQLIEDFSFVFRDGRVVDFQAGAGQKVLEGMLDTDEGSRRLGEVALVADNSPIANTGILFRNTLFDENASCHFALGRAYSENLKGAAQMDEEEQAKAGMNFSLEHIDFMVGSKAVTVTGIKEDGSAVVLLRDGDWQI